MIHRNEDLLKVTKDQILEIRKAANIKDNEHLKDLVDIVEMWYKTNENLPSSGFDRDVVERILISRQGDVEETKSKIETIFTMKALVPELAEPRDILNPHIQNAFDCMLFTPMPKLNNDNSRINLYRYTPNVENYEFKYFLNYLFMSIEYRLKCDYAKGDRSLIDLQHRTLAHMSTETPVMLKNCELFIREGYGIRLLGLHIINAPPFINSILNLVKTVFSSELAELIFVHPNYDDLHKHIDRAILPVEYGGDERPAAELADLWKKEYSNGPVRNYLLQQESLKMDKTKISKLNDDLMDMSGGFRSLQVD